MGISCTDERGIGLIGSVIAIAILMLVVFAIASLFRHGSILTVRTKTALRATHMIEEKMEELRDIGGPAIEAHTDGSTWPGTIGDTYTMDTTVPPNNPAKMSTLVEYYDDGADSYDINDADGDTRDYLRANITIEWTEDKSVKRRRQAVTYLKR